MIRGDWNESNTLGDKEQAIDRVLDQADGGDGGHRHRGHASKSTTDKEDAIARLILDRWIEVGLLRQRAPSCTIL